MAQTKINLPEFRAQMGRAGINRSDLARYAGFPKTTAWRVLTGKSIELETFLRAVRGLNKALTEAGFPTVTLNDLIIETDDDEDSARPVAAGTLELTYS